MTIQTHKFTRYLHWSSAFLIIGLLTSGIYMADGNDYSLYDWHKSFGVIALLFVIMRLYYRKANPWQSSAKGTQHETLVHRMHQCLLFICVLMPLSGIAYSGLGGHGVSIFGIILIADTYTQSGQVVPLNLLGSNIAKAVHYYIGYLMSALVFFHASAALKHHFIDKDCTLKNMLTTSTPTQNRNSGEEA